MTWTRSVRELFSQRVGFYWNRTLASSIMARSSLWSLSIIHMHTHTHTHTHTLSHTVAMVQRLEKCYGDLSGIMSRLRENELFNHLNDKVRIDQFTVMM